MRLTMKGKNGSLNQFTQKVKNKHGEIIEYPKVNGIRDPNNPKHWRWKLTWKEKIDLIEQSMPNITSAEYLIKFTLYDRWLTRGLLVKPRQVAKVQKSIAGNVGIEEIREFLSCKKF